MEIIASFPVKAYLKRYVHWKENLTEGEVLDLAGAGEIALVLSGVLTGKLEAIANTLPEKVPAHYDEKLMFRLTVDQVNRNLMFYTYDGVRYFNTWLYRNFHESLLQMILVGRAYGINEVETIWKFMDNLDLHDLISFDALKKASYRLRKDRKLPVFRVVNRQTP